MGQWHIDGAAALIVDGTRFTRQTYNYRNERGGTYFTYTAWLKADDQTGPGLVFTAPLYLPDAIYSTWDDNQHAFVDVQGMVLKERTFEYYGETGWYIGATPQYITGLGVYTPQEAAGWRVLTLKNLLLRNRAPTPLYIDNKWQRIGGGGFSYHSHGSYFHFEVNLLGQDLIWS